jgi:circadian clock protein KaiC
MSDAVRQKPLTSYDSEKCGTGVPGLDSVMGGGYPTNHLFLIEGDPGTGKTTLALQFLMEGVRQGERGLYVTLSENARRRGAQARLTVHRFPSV